MPMEEKNKDDELTKQYLEILEQNKKLTDSLLKPYIVINNERTKKFQLNLNETLMKAKILNEDRIKSIQNLIKVTTPIYDKQFENLLHQTQIISQALRPINKMIFEIFENPAYKSLFNLRIDLSNSFNFITDYMKGPSLAFQKAIEEAKKDPDNIWNYIDYKNALKNFLWAFPYDISTDELKRILSNVHDEREFDVFMKTYFDNTKVNKMIEDIQYQLRGQQLTLFKQAVFAYKNKKYSLANMAIISLIDYTLSYYLENKKTTARKGILDPIINELFEIDLNEYGPFSLQLAMLGNNIDIVFENMDFNGYAISTHKKVRRHPSQHGFAFSNKKIDSLMLFNLLFNILSTKKELRNYKGKIIHNRQGGFKLKKQI